MGGNDVLIGWFKDEFKAGNTYKYLDIVIRDGVLTLSNDERSIKKQRYHMVGMGNIKIPSKLNGVKFGGLQVYFDIEMLQDGRLLIPYDLYEGDLVVRLGVKNNIDGFIKNALILRHGKLEAKELSEENLVGYLSSGIVDFMSDLQELKDLMRKEV